MNLVVTFAEQAKFGYAESYLMMEVGVPTYCARHIYKGQLEEIFSQLSSSGDDEVSPIIRSSISSDRRFMIEDVSRATMIALQQNHAIESVRNDSGVVATLKQSVMSLFKDIDPIREFV